MCECECVCERERECASKCCPPQSGGKSSRTRISPTWEGHLITPSSAVTYPYIAHCMGACSAKGEWSLFSLSLSLSSLSPLYTVLPIVQENSSKCCPPQRGGKSSRTRISPT